MSQLNARGKVPPIVTWQGKQAFEVTYVPGKRGPSGSNAATDLAPAGVFPTEECTVQFKVWFADNFVWEESRNPRHRVGGKLGGFKVGEGDASGGKYSTTGASYRVVFDEGGLARGYLYPQVRQIYRGRTVPWALLDQLPAVQAIAQVATGVHIWYKDDVFRFYKGRWNDVRMYMKLNTPGQKDGVMELTVNGVTKRLEGVRYRYDNAKINRFDLTTFFGGSTLEYAPPTTTKTWFADFAFSNAPGGTSGASGTSRLRALSTGVRNVIRALPKPNPKKIFQLQ